MSPMEVTDRWDVDDPDVDAFVDANIVSFAAWDLVIYLNRNPETCEPLSALAAVLARQEPDLMPAVHRLVGSGVLVESSAADVMRYSLTEDPAVRAVSARFLALAARRENRLEFVRRVLAHGMGG
jgi:uncharacterized protein (DUF2342 family)